MSISINLLTSGSQTGTSGFSSASVTVTPGALVLVNLYINATLGPGTPNLSGLSGSWPTVRTQTNGTPLFMRTFCDMFTIASSGTITFAWGGGVKDLVLYSIFEVTGVTTNGNSVNGQGAITQSNSANASSVTLSAFAFPTNAAIGFFTNNTATSITVGSGFSSIHSVNSGGPPGDLRTEYRIDADTSVDCTNGGMGIALELNSAKLANSLITLQAVNRASTY